MLVLLCTGEHLTLRELQSLSTVLQSLWTIRGIPAKIAEFQRFIYHVFHTWNSSSPISPLPVLRDHFFTETRIRVGILKENHPLNARQI